MARSLKDAFCRYKTMKGFQVKRKAGWDTHGLPVELGVEKELNITKEDIGKNISIADYNAHCRRNVMKYTQEWTELSRQMGYWVDMENPYITYDNSYIESVWWLLGQLYEKGLLYKGYTIPLSLFHSLQPLTCWLHNPPYSKDCRLKAARSISRVRSMRHHLTSVTYRHSFLSLPPLMIPLELMPT